METPDTNHVPSVNLEELCKALEKFAALEKATFKKDSVDGDFLKKVQQWSRGLFRIVVMGEIKKGKSSFINAMLGHENLVPVSSDVATSTIYKIAYGSEVTYRVVFKSDSGKDMLSIPREKLAEYGTEDGNPGNEKNVDFIMVTCPSPVLKGGLVIIDTPGLGGLFRQHKRITWEYVPKADAVFLVTDSVESPIGKGELELLDDVRKITKNVLFVQTKCMAVDKTAREARKENNFKILEKYGMSRDSIRYVMVDSHLRFDAEKSKDKEDLMDSGFPGLMRYIDDGIKPGIQKYIMAQALRVVRPRIVAVREAIEQEKAILESGTSEKQVVLRKEIDNAEEDIRKWERNEMPAIQEDFKKLHKELQKSVTELINYFSPDGTCMQELDEIVSKASTLDEVSAVAGRMSEIIPEYCSSQLLEVQRSILQKISAFAAKFNLSKPPMEIGNDDVLISINDIRRVPTSIESGNSTFSNARNSFYGGSFGTSVGGFIGGAIGSVVPGVGTTIGAWIGAAIGGIWGGYQAISISNNAQMEKATAQLRAGIKTALASFSRQAQQQLGQQIADIRDQFASALSEAVQKRKDNFAARKRELDARARASAEELAESKKRVTALEQGYRNVVKVLNAVG